MTIRELIETLPIRLIRGSADTVVTDVTDDSRTVQPGAVFIARAGTRDDGRKYINAAIKSGAATVLTDESGSRGLIPPHGAGTFPTVLMVEGDERLFAQGAATIAERFFGCPTSILTVIGITGTNGKTTTTHLTQQILDAAGMKAGLLGTVFIDDGESQTPANLTTPGAIDLARTMARMVANDCTHVVMEASSHALEQGRTAAIRFDVGVFTNLTGDHLDYHRTMDAYAAAKAILFDRLPVDGAAVVNAEDATWFERMLRDCRASRVYECRVAGQPTDDRRSRAECSRNLQCSVTIRSFSSHGTVAQFKGPWGEFDVELPLVGRHNVSNALQAAAASFDCGAPVETIARTLGRCAAPPGRLELVPVPDNQFTVLVDYAHTDDALTNVLSAIRPIVPTDARLIVVFGCGGDRDRTKRPRMAAAACRLADQIWITSDNPRTEDPLAIISEILTGVPSNARQKVREQPDRQLAIHEAIASARRGDVILIAGKGHEDYQIIGTTKRPFDDREIARAAIESHRRPLEENPVATRRVVART